MASAKEYNRDADGVVWISPQLPPDLGGPYVKHGAGSAEFAKAVRTMQQDLGLVDDGKLGPLTWEAVETATYVSGKPMREQDKGERWSGLTSEVVRSRRSLKKRNWKKVLAAMIHTTGSGIVAKAKKKGMSPMDYAIRYYAGPKAYTSHYLMDWDGRIVGIVPEDLRALHAGMSDARLRLYRAGHGTWSRWLKPLNPKKPPTPSDIASKEDGMILYRQPFKGHLWWRDRWSDLSDPSRVIGNLNTHTVALDLLPASKSDGGIHPGGFTDAQKDALEAWVLDLRQRVGWSLPVIGHADGDPIVRNDAKGSWDPRCLLHWDVFADAPKLRR